MTGHEITMRDLYQLVTEVRDDVNVIKENLSSIRDTAKDHETRIRAVEREKAHNAEISQLQVSIDDLKKKVYMFSGGAVVISAVVGPILNSWLGKG